MKVEVSLFNQSIFRKKDQGLKTQKFQYNFVNQEKNFFEEINLCEILREFDS